MPALTLRNAVAAIDRMGVCLLYPLDNRPEPASLWSHFHPGRAMRWDWDSGADDRVVNLWHLRTELSQSGKVAYAKWFRGRATFFSLPVFSALVRELAVDEELGLPDEAQRLYRAFEEKSPLSTKESKEAADLRGKAFERDWERGMKELWQRLLVVGWGERDEGSFPSLEVGASKWMLEGAWRAGRAMALEDARAVVERSLPEGSLFRRQLERVRRPSRPGALHPDPG